MRKYYWSPFLMLVVAALLAILAAACSQTMPEPAMPPPPATSQATPAPSVPGPTSPELPKPSAATSSPTTTSTTTPAPSPETKPQPATTISSPTPAPMPRGVADPDLLVEVYEADKVWAGTTLLADNHNLARPRIMEVNMRGEIVWQYLVPDNLKQYTNPGFDVELLPNNNVLFVLPRKGVYEIDRKGNVVWSYLTEKISHDADRLPNGNTIFVFGAYDQKDDAQVREINQKGEIVWSWYARDHFNKPPYKDISVEGWTHTNAVSRLPNGNTLISLRNFNFVVDVSPQGSVVRAIGEGILRDQHDPALLPNGNILMADHSEPQRAIEIDLKTGETVWQFAFPRQLVRDADRLPNGNTLITGAMRIVEVDGSGNVVWRFGLKEPLERGEAPMRGFYKAQRIATK